MCLLCSRCYSSIRQCLNNHLSCSIKFEVVDFKDLAFIKVSQVEDVDLLSLKKESRKMI